MEKNIIITGPTGTGKSVIIARYWAENHKESKLLDGIELKESPHVEFSDEEVAEFKNCPVLILDSMFMEFPVPLQCMKTVLDILESRYTSGKTIVIAEQNTAIMERMDIPFINKILEGSFHMQLTNMKDADAALTILEKLITAFAGEIKVTDEMGKLADEIATEIEEEETKYKTFHYIYYNAHLTLWATIIICIAFTLKPSLDGLGTISAREAADLAGKQVVFRFLCLAAILISMYLTNSNLYHNRPYHEVHCSMIPLGIMSIILILIHILLNS